MYTSAVLTFTGIAQTITPGSITPGTAKINITGSTINVAPNWTGTTLTRLNLDRLQSNIGIVRSRDGDLPANPMFMRQYQDALDAIESVLNNTISSVEQIQRALDEAAAAKAAAAEAEAKAVAVEIEGNVKSSRTEPLDVLTASNDGTVTIAAHSRIYGDESSVSVDGGSITGQFGTVYVYYEDPNRTGGAVSYQTSASQKAQGNGVHVVGAVTVPDVGAPESTGVAPLPPGFITIDVNVL